MKLKYVVLLLTVAVNTAALAKPMTFGTPFFSHYHVQPELKTKMLKIAEVKELAQHLKKGAEVFVIVTATPSQGDPYYEIQVGYHDASGDDSKYIFRLKKDYLHQKDFEPYLEIIDLKRGAYVPLAVYRKSHNK